MPRGPANPRVGLRAAAKFGVSLVLLVAAAPVATRAADITSNHRDTFGEVGLLDMPSARMAPDGQLAFSMAGINAGQRFALSFQLLPWLEGSFRYSRLPNVSGKGHPEFDRSFGLKMRLFQETEYTPDISLGIRDILGTGIYSAEYLAASKRISDFDVTAGLGWGRLAGNGTFTNPFGLIFKSFKTRKGFSGQGGTVNFGEFFHGPDAGLFGGITWHTPIDNLDLTAEYSSDKYTLEGSVGSIKVRMPVNVGVSYQPFENTLFTAGWYYGNSVGATLTFFFDPTKPFASAKIGPQPPSVNIRTDQQQASALALLVPGPTGQRRGTLGGVVMHGSSGYTAIAHLVDALAPASNVEINGTTLVVFQHAEGQAAVDCYTYASLAENMHIDKIELRDLDTRGSASCAVPQALAEPLDVSATPPFSAWTSSIAQTTDTRTLVDQSSDSEAGNASAKEAIRNDAAAQALRIEVMSIGKSEIWVYYSNARYEFEDEAIGRLTRVLMADAPSRIEIFRLIPVVYGVPMQDVEISRSSLERVFATHGTLESAPDAVTVNHAPYDNPVLEADQEGTYPRFSWSISPALRIGLFDPTSPVRFELYAAFDGAVDLLPGLTLQGEYQASIYDTFTQKTPPESQLPHVRTDIAKYLTTGRYGFSNLDIAYRTRLTPDVYAELKAGYLEDMYAGVGAQVLWRPEGERWALGADIYQVWKRNFDRLFGLQSYKILTGHVSLYYDSPWYGLNFAVHAGRYLAGDRGVTIEVSRRFLTNVEVGAYATFTNVPFSKFGEGSFDKGIFIRIPLEWALPFSTQSEYDLTLSSLTRDGGQRLYGDDSLYDETERTSFGEILQHQDQIVPP